MAPSWSPDWCTHVLGSPRPQSSDDEPSDPIKVDLHCLVCGDRWLAHCFSGQWHLRVIRFAFVHYECWYRPMSAKTVKYHLG